MIKLFKELSRIYILFLIGSIGTVISTLWLLHNFDFPPVLSVLTSLSALVSDFLLENKRNKDNRNDNLQKLNKKDLLQIIFERNGKCNSKLSKIELISQIKREEEKHLYKLSKIKIITVVLIFISIPIIYKIFPPLKNTSPKYGISFYESDNNKYKLISTDSLKFEVFPEDMKNNQIKLPLKIAIRNEEQVPINITKIVLTYPSNIMVKSSGTHKIDPKLSTIVYEQKFETLEATDQFTPLKAVDTLIIPFKYMATKIITIGKGNIPISSIVITDQAIIKSFYFKFKIEIYCENRPKVTGIFNAHIKPNLQMFFDFPEGEKSVLLKEDKELFYKLPQKSDIIVSWSDTYLKTNQQFQYIKSKYKSHIIQYLYVDNILRRVTVANENDGIINYQIVNDDNDSEPNYKINGDNNSVIFDLSKEDLN